MTNPLHPAALLLAAALAPTCVSAQSVETSEVGLTSLATYDRRSEPRVSDADNKNAPSGTPISVEALAFGAGQPFPGVPSTQTRAFASSALDSSGNFGVGVSGFFLPSNLPPDQLVATGTFSVTYTNNTTQDARVGFDFFVPPPIIQITGQGVGDFFPRGADPRRDVAAAVNVSIVTTLTRPDGSVVEDTVLDYGMRLVRDPVSGVQSAIGLGDAFGLVERFDVSVLQREFQLPGLAFTDVVLDPFGPGDTFEFRYDFFASASTGFGETGMFAAIGDPFDLSVGAGRLDIRLVSAVPEPGAGVLLGIGLLAVVAGYRACRRHDDTGGRGGPQAPVP